MLISTLQRDTVVCDFLKSLAVPRALTAYLLYVNNEHEQLSELKFIPTDYNDVEDARSALAATSLLSKAPFLQISKDLKQVALEKFAQAELQCHQTNRRIYRSDLSDNALQALDFMEGLIARVLGPFDVDEWFEGAGWGPGATTAINRRVSNPSYKFSNERCITKALYDLIFTSFNEAFPLWGGSVKAFCLDGKSKVVTVPKNAKTDRTIAIEPGLNLFFQRGLGRMMRRRLARVGVDLSDQNRNALLAKSGSVDDSLATVDFSAASDTISRALVHRLLPERWYAVCDASRSHAGKLGTRTLYFEKFSSMGNGFTFELETLIFWSLAQYCVRNSSRKTVSAYGDDVILPKVNYNEYATLAHELGFTVNMEKSYASSPYRESCGSHWWAGVDIRPIFLKKEIYDYQATISLANQIRLFARRCRYDCGCDKRFRRVWERVRDYLPAKTPRTPIQLGDAGIISRENESGACRFRIGGGHEGFYVKGLVAKPETFMESGTIGLLLYKLKVLDVAQVVSAFVAGLTELPHIDGGNSLIVPFSQRYRVKRIRCLQWPDLGEWF